ncbi:hypothetical protein BH09PSE5_BH09PSE5_13040 [soil metagenome]
MISRDHVMQTRSSTAVSNRLSGRLPVHVPGNPPLSPNPLNTGTVECQSHATAPTFTLAVPTPARSAEQHRIAFLAYHFTHPDNPASRNRIAYNEENCVTLGAVQCRDWLVDEELRRRSVGLKEPPAPRLRHAETIRDPDVVAAERALAIAQTKAEGKKKAEQLTQSGPGGSFMKFRIADITRAPRLKTEPFVFGPSVSPRPTGLPKVSTEQQAAHRDDFLAFHGAKPVRVLPSSVAAFNSARGVRLETKVVRGWVSDDRKAKAAATESTRRRQPESQVHVPGHRDMLNQETRSVSSEMDFSDLLLRDAELPAILLAPNEQIPAPGLPARAYRNVLVETFRNSDRPLKEVIASLNHFYATDITHQEARHWVARDHLISSKLVPRMVRFFEEYGSMTTTQARSHPCFPTGRISEVAVRSARMEARRLIDARADAHETPMQVQRQTRPVASAPTRPLADAPIVVFIDATTGMKYDLVPHPRSPEQTAAVGGRPVLQPNQRPVQLATTVPSALQRPLAVEDGLDQLFDEGFDQVFAGDHASAPQSSLMDVDVDELAADLATDMGADLMTAMSDTANGDAGPDPARAAEDFADVWEWMNTDTTTQPSAMEQPWPGPRSPGSMLAPSGPLDDFDWGFL